MSRNFSLKLIVIKILEKINVLFFYYITLLWKVLGVALGISATFRTRQSWCSCAHSVDGRFSTPVAFVHSYCIPQFPHDFPISNLMNTAYPPPILIVQSFTAITFHILCHVNSIEIQSSAISHGLCVERTYQHREAALLLPLLEPRSAPK